MFVTSPVDRLHARARGRLLQGPARSVHELSRGGSAAGVVDAMTVAAVQALERGGDT